MKTSRRLDKAIDTINGYVNDPTIMQLMETLNEIYHEVLALEDAGEKHEKPLRGDK